MYTHYALIKDNEVVEYPADPRKADPTLPPFWLGGEVGGNVYVFCHNFPPVTDHTQDLVEIAPAYNEEAGAWYRQYQVVAASPELLAQRWREQIDGIANSVAYYNSVADEVLTNELSSEQRNEWLQYKNAVNAVWSQPGFPWGIAWPQRPDANTLNIGVTRL